MSNSLNNLKRIIGTERERERASASDKKRHVGLNSFKVTRNAKPDDHSSIMKKVGVSPGRSK